MKKFIYNIINSVMVPYTKNQSPETIAQSIVIGIYIAFCPFIGFHTIMVFIFSWIFSLHFPVTLATSVIINNPWTMIPIYATDYIVGQYIVQLANIPIEFYEPAWMNICNEWLFYYTGIHHISFMTFLIGGNLLSISISAMLYPIIKKYIRYCHTFANES